MTKWIGLLGGGAAVAAVGAGLYVSGILSPNAPVPEPQQAVATPQDTQAEDTGSPRTAPEAEPEPEPEPEPQDAAPPIAAPAFDVVRVEPDGSALVAGTAEAGARVRVLLDGEDVAQSDAATDGKFVSLMSLAASDKPRMLSLSMRVGGQEYLSETDIIVAPFGADPEIAALDPEDPPQTPVNTPDTPETDAPEQVAPEEDTPDQVIPEATPDEAPAPAAEPESPADAAAEPENAGADGNAGPETANDPETPPQGTGESPETAGPDPVFAEAEEPQTDGAAPADAPQPPVAEETVAIAKDSPEQADTDRPASVPEIEERGATPSPAAQEDVDMARATAPERSGTADPETANAAGNPGALPDQDVEEGGNVLAQVDASDVRPPPGPDRPETDRPETDRPETDRPETDRPETDRPETVSPEPAETPATADAEGAADPDARGSAPDPDPEDTGPIPRAEETPQPATEPSRPSGGTAEEVAKAANTPAPDTTEPDAAEPDAAEPDAAEPATTEPDTAEPDSKEPATAEPATTEPDAAAPATAEPATTEPDAAEPATAEPDAAEPDSKEPDTTEPATTNPEPDAPTQTPQTPQTPRTAGDVAADKESDADIAMADTGARDKDSQPPEPVSDTTDAVTDNGASAADPGGPSEPAPPTLLASDEDGVRVLAGPEVLESVAIDTISYDDKGDVALSGRGAGSLGGGFVRVYLDNTPITTSRIREDGSWRVALPEVDKGVYTLRVDEVDDDGTVKSRAETPFLREDRETLDRVAQEKGSKAPVDVVTVQPGNTLWQIARDRYGEGLLYVRVFKANRGQIRDPDLIYPGQVFDLPEGQD